MLALKWLADLRCGSINASIFSPFYLDILVQRVKAVVSSRSLRSRRIGPKTTDDPLWASDDEFDHDVSSLEGGSESRASEV